jgi:hypothetical protein
LLARRECNEALQQIGARQADINAYMMRKIMSLEKTLADARAATVSQWTSAGRHNRHVQADSPHAGPYRWHPSSGHVMIGNV